MRNVIIICFFSILVGVVLIFSKEPSSDNNEKLSESLGILIGKQIKTMGIPIDMKKMIKGLNNGLSGKEAPISEEECLKILNAMEEKYLLSLADSNLKNAIEFLDKNVQNADVISLEDNKIQYQILKTGNGNTINNYNQPLIRYSGKFVNGETFLSLTEDKINLNEIIPGLSKALIGMKEGEKRSIFIHPDFGFGKTFFPPNALIIFEVEVLQAECSTLPSKEIADQKIF